MSETKTRITQANKWRFHTQIFKHLTKDMDIVTDAHIKQKAAELLDPYFEQTIDPELMRAYRLVKRNMYYIRINSGNSGSLFLYYDNCLPEGNIYNVPSDIYNTLRNLQVRYAADHKKTRIISNHISAILRVVVDLETLQELFPELTFELGKGSVRQRKSNVKLATKRLEELNELIRKQ